MSRLDSRSSRAGRLFRTTLAPMDAVLRRAGRAAGRAPVFDGFEQLENRILLGGDHPNFGQVFNTPNPVPPTVISLDGSGAGTANGDIDKPFDNDMFVFTAPSNDFVTVWADTINPGSTLDSHIQIYTGTPGGAATLIRSGAHSDQLTSGFNSDGWVGFIATAGTDYFVRILSDTTTGAAATGEYVVRVKAKTTAFPALNPVSGVGQQAGSISIVGSDIVYKVAAGPNGEFNSLTTIYGQANANLFDTRLDVYNAQGQRMAFDSEAGRLSNAYTTIKGQPNLTYYVRVRSDEFSLASPTATGNFTLVIDAIATVVDVDPVSRRGGIPGTAGGQTTQLWRFKSQGTGVAFITVVPFGFPPLADPAVHVHDDTGTRIAFNDDFAGLSAQVQIPLVGGGQYYVVVEGFDVPNVGIYWLAIESNHTWNVIGTIWDDHQNTPNYDPQQPPEFGTPEYDAIRRQFNLATPLVWNDPTVFLDPAGNPIKDRGSVVQAFGTGRIFGGADTDLFQFTAPVDMLSEWAGVNSDVGTALYAGGAFTQAGTTFPNTPADANHIAAWDWGDWWPARRGLNGDVFAMTVYDEDQLFVGGSFTLAGNTANPDDDIVVNRIARWSYNPLIGDYVWSAVGAGFAGTVRALTTYDLPMVGPVVVAAGEFGSVQAFSPDTGWFSLGAHNNIVYALDAFEIDGDEYLIAGGSFTTIGGTAANRLGATLGAGWQVVGAPGANGVNGTVRALTVYENPDNDAPDLIIGGEFTTGGGVAASRLIAYRFDDQAMPGPHVWTPLAGGANNTVHALVVFDDGAGPLPDPVLIAGGEFTNIGSRISLWTGGAWLPMGDGVNNTVYSLTTFADDDPFTFDTEPALYVGGQFTIADGNVQASHVAKWEFNPSPFVMAFVWTGLEAGTNGIVYSLVEYDDGNPAQWDRHQRPGTRLQIVVSPVTGSFLNTFTRVYDSNFNLLYSNDTIAPPFPDPSGMVDPSMTIATLGEIEGIRIWGGEVYYIEVSGVGGTGRYQLSVRADAWLAEDINSLAFEPPGAGAWSQAPEIVLTNVTGDARNFLPPLNAAHNVKFMDPWPPITQFQELGMIHSITDQDLFFFRAPANGTAEVRINTTQLGDQYTEFLGPAVLSNQTKTLNSPLDSVLRIFDNDFIPLTLNDDNAAVQGEYQTTNVGQFANRTFFRRDSSVVFPVQAGKAYFIQVESGQREAFLAGLLHEVDWRNAIGGYELLINTMPDLLLSNDDHVNTDFTQATVIPISQDQGDPNNGIGAVAGVILNHPMFNPTDADMFTFQAPGDGSAKITVVPKPGSPLIPTLQVYGANQVIVAQLSAVSPGETISVNVAAFQGNRFYVRVSDPGGTQGAYSVNVGGVPYVDDHAGLHKWNLATEIPDNVYDYSGIAVIDGSLETRNDTDVFRFKTTLFDVVNITVTGHGTLTPVVRIYEVGEDPVGNPILLQVGWAGTGAGNIASVNFPITGPERTSLLTGNTYNDYYIVISSADPVNQPGGDYTLVLNITPTDDHPDEGQFDVATPLPLDPATGNATSSGIIEIESDTDLFQFTTVSQGLVIISVSSVITSNLLPSVRIFDSDFTPIKDITTGQELVIAPDNFIATATFKFLAKTAKTFYILIDGAPGGVIKNELTGAYVLGVNTTLGDDHPNEGEFSIATEIILSPFTGDGLATGFIHFDNAIDTDLFTFTTILPGAVKITVSTPGSPLVPFMRLYDGDENEIGEGVTDGGPGDEDGQLNGAITRTIDASAAGQVYYILITGEPSLFQPGGYSLFLNGPALPQPPDDHPNAGEFELATIVQLSPLTGDGKAAGVLETIIDTDLFTFSSLKQGRVFAQVITPKGQPLDVSLRVIGPDMFSQLAFNQAGYPGVNANVAFTVAEPNQQYWLLVEGDGINTGSYTLRIDAEPDTHFLFFPEGFSNKQIHEYVSIVNPNPFDITYSIKLHYETGELESVLVSNAILPAGTRGGLGISDGAKGAAAGVRTNTPYAVIVESDAPIGATLAHYDFGISTGEAFTKSPSDVWTIAHAERINGAVNDFVVFYNPNPTDTVVTLTAYSPAGESVEISQTVGAFRRGGWSINAATQLPLGPFAIRLTSAPAEPGADHIGIVASITHFDLVNDSGYLALGDPDGGATRGVITGITQGPASDASVSFFNPTATSASITITGTYIGTGLPNFTRVIEVPAFNSVTYSGVQLGLVASQPAGLRYESTAPVTVLFSQRQFGDADGMHAITQAGSHYFFGDAFLNIAKAGVTYFETLYFYNPAPFDLPLTLTIHFWDGAQGQADVVVAPNNYTIVNLHQLPAILERGGLQAFSIEVSGPSAFVASMTHYDLFLNGGWGTPGAPLGLVNPLSQI